MYLNVSRPIPMTGAIIILSETDKLTKNKKIKSLNAQRKRIVRIVTTLA